MIAVIEGCGNNLSSITNALNRLECDFVLTQEASLIQQADKVILPGVGAAGTAMKNLRSNGLIDIIPGLKQPFLGICLGMQLLFEFSEENDTPCLAIFPGVIEKFKAMDIYPVPHMGWNRIQHHHHPLFSDIANDSFFYFVHSYYARVNQYTLATCNYDSNFSCVVKKNNFIGMQFHPEKSSQLGINLLRNFLEKM